MRDVQKSRKGTLRTFLFGALVVTGLGIALVVADDNPRTQARNRAALNRQAARETRLNGQQARPMPAGVSGLAQPHP